MANAVIAAAQMYLDKSIMAPYIHAKTAILHDPEKFDYSLFGESTRIREVIGGKASNYSKSLGFQAGGEGGSVSWSDFKPDFDREKTIKVDAIDEYNSILQGMTPSGVLAIEAFWKNFGAEIDATTISTLYAKTPEANVFTTALQQGYELDKANVFDTLLNIQNSIFNNGYEGKIAVFVDATTISAIRSALLPNGLANSSVVKISPVSDEDLSVNLNVINFNNLVIIPLPSNRMYTEIVVLDGVTPGQEQGGYVVAPLAKQIKLLAVPFEAAALSIRHLVSNITVPASLQGNLSLGKVEKEISSLNELYQGQAMLQNIGIDQTADQFKYMNRIIYGAELFESWVNTVFVITEP